MPRIVPWYMLGALLLAALVAGALLVSRRAPVAPDDPESVPRREVGRQHEELFRGFVGSAVCNDCHAEIYAAYLRSGMASSWQSVGEVLPDHFLRDDVIADAQGVYRYRIGVDENGRPLQEETLVEHADHITPLNQAARYLVGSGHHAQALVTESNGYLHLMPLAWFAGQNQWRLNPGYEHYNHRFNRPISPECIGCHGTYAEHRPPARNCFVQPIPPGIGCERCHGPGAEHVARYQGSSKIEAGQHGDIINPGRLPAERGNDVCLQCHLQGDAIIYRDGKDAFTFRPGERLRDHRVDLLAESNGETGFGVASHGARLLQSACYRQSGQLTCFRCHDPHRPIADFSNSDFDSRCVECHQPHECSRVAPLEEKRLPAGCVECHMLQQRTRESIHLVFTDHWIRRRPAPPGSTQPLSPNADVTLVSPWPDEKPDAATLGAAYVWLHEALTPQEPSLHRGVKLLEDVAASGAIDFQGEYWLGSGLVSQRRSAEAIRVLEELLNRLNGLNAAEAAGSGIRIGSFSQEVRFRLAIAYHQSGEFNRAAGEYERLIQEAPDWLEPYQPLWRIHLFRGRTARAVEVLRQRLERLPDAEANADLALALWLTGRRPEECLPLTEAALQLDPLNTRVHLVRGQLFTEAGGVESAAESYRQVLRIEAGHPAAEEALKRLKAD